MSLEIIKRRERVTQTIRRHEFSYIDEPGAGFSFDVDDQGEIIVTDGNRENVELCLRGEGLVDEGIGSISWSYVEDAVGRCECGREVQLTDSRAGNDCGCGRIYNSFGQELAARSLWGEETGETYTDIIQGGVDS